MQQGPRQQVDACGTQLAFAPLIKIVVQGLTRVELTLDAIETGLELNSRGEVRIDRHVYCAVLYAVAVTGQPQHGATVVFAPGDEHGRP